MAQTSVTMPSMVRIVGRAPAVDEKCDVFCLFFVTVWIDEVCNNGNAMMQWNFQNNYGVIALRDVCSCAPVFNFFVDPRNFPLGANLYQKLPFFMIVGAVSPHFFMPPR